jgi:hypothetical protein
MQHPVHAVLMQRQVCAMVMPLQVHSLVMWHTVHAMGMQHQHRVHAVVLRPLVHVMGMHRDVVAVVLRHMVSVSLGKQGGGVGSMPSCCETSRELVQLVLFPPCAL